MGGVALQARGFAAAAVCCVLGKASRARSELGSARRCGFLWLFFCQAPAMVIAEEGVRFRMGFPVLPFCQRAVGVRFFALVKPMC